MGNGISFSVASSGHRCAGGKLKKVIRKDGKRYYRAGKSGLVKLKAKERPPKLKKRKS
jgi:hypothetical protein